VCQQGTVSLIPFLHDFDGFVGELLQDFTRMNQFAVPVGAQRKHRGVLWHNCCRDRLQDSACWRPEDLNVQGVSGPRASSPAPAKIGDESLKGVSISILMGAVHAADDGCHYRQ